MVDHDASSADCGNQTRTVDSLYGTIKIACAHTVVTLNAHRQYIFSHITFCFYATFLRWLKCSIFQLESTHRVRTFANAVRIRRPTSPKHVKNIHPQLFQFVLNAENANISQWWKRGKIDPASADPDPDQLQSEGLLIRKISWTFSHNF